MDQGNYLAYVETKKEQKQQECGKTVETDKNSQIFPGFLGSPGSLEPCSDDFATKLKAFVALLAQQNVLGVVHWV